MENYLYPNHPLRCITYGPSNVGKSVVLTNLVLNNINEYDKIYIYSPSLYQHLYQKLNKCFSNYIPIHIILNILNEGDIDIVNDEIVVNKDFEVSDIEIETFDSMKELNCPQEYGNKCNFILEDLIEKEIINDTIQTTFKRGRHNKLSIFVISQDFYE